MQNPIRSVQDLARWSVNRKDQLEVVRQTLYDFQQYPAAGAAQIMFFQVPVGQPQGGITKTLGQTNMTLAGQLPAPWRFLVQAIETYFYPGALPSTGPLAAVTDKFWLDLWAFYSGQATVGGNTNTLPFLQFFIGSKPYLNEGGGFMNFPPFGRLDGFATNSDTTTAGAAGYNKISYGTAAGRPYITDPPMLLEPTQNWNVTLNWQNSVVPLSAQAVVGVRLNGVLVRNSQ
jgi:hypothetical protein